MGVNGASLLCFFEGLEDYEDDYEYSKYDDTGVDVWAGPGVFASAPLEGKEECYKTCRENTCAEEIESFEFLAQRELAVEWDFPLESPTGDGKGHSASRWENIRFDWNQTW